MNSTQRREIEVWADWSALGGPIFLGPLYATRARGKEIFSFEYDSNWLLGPHAQGHWHLRMT